MPRIETKIQIDAPADIVWSELIDMSQYSEWNPFIEYEDGETSKGEKLQLKIVQPSGMSFSIKPTVTENRENQKFEWLGRLLMPGIFDGRHTFELAEENGTTTFRHYETFTGILKYPMGWFGVYRKTRPGFELMNQKLKQRAEERFAASRA